MAVLSPCALLMGYLIIFLPDNHSDDKTFIFGFMLYMAADLCFDSVHSPYAMTLLVSKCVTEERDVLWSVSMRCWTVTAAAPQVSGVPLRVQLFLYGVLMKEMFVCVFCTCDILGISTTSHLAEKPRSLRRLSDWKVTDIVSLLWRWPPLGKGRCYHSGSLKREEKNVSKRRKYYELCLLIWIQFPWLAVVWADSTVYNNNFTHIKPWISNRIVDWNTFVFTYECF